MRILALQLKRIGDLILTTPALAALRTAAPKVHLTVAVHSSTAPLLPALPQIDSSIVLGPGRGWTPWQQALTGGYEAVLDFTGSDRSALLTALTRAPRRIAFAQTRKRWIRSLAYHEFVEASVRELHTIDYNLALTKPLGATPTLTAPELHLPEGRPLIEEPYALIHPGTARAEKYWLPERWAAVIAHCRERGLPCVLTGGQDPFERAHLAAIEAAAGPPLQNLAGQIDLVALAGLVARARLVISVDTAVVHLGAAFARPQIALFGPTNPAHWRPRHPGAIVLSASAPEGPLTEFDPRRPGAPMDRLSTEAVIRATDSLLV